MNLDELKAAWKIFDDRLQATQVINEKIIISMITQRSSTRFSKVKTEYVLGLSWMLICLMVGCAVFFGNPFDYELTVQYIPIAIYCICLIILMASLVTAYLQWQNISITHNNLDVALRKIIAVYERPKKFINYTLIVFLATSVCLFPLSFLPHSIERLGFWPALGERLIPMSVAAFLLFIAHKMGAFRERHVEKFKEDLGELEELKVMSAELSKNEIVV
jgi:hypothetical protein